MARLHLLLVIVAAVTPAFAQGRIAFEVASVRPVSAEQSVNRPGLGLATAVHIGPSHVRLQEMTLRDCIAMAYRLNRDRIVGPDWITSTRFDIAATLPSGATRQQVPDMLQSLLADRFRLRVHRETREMPAYAIEAGGELKLVPVEPDPAPADQSVSVTTEGTPSGIEVRMARGATYTLVQDRFEARKVTMPVLADAMSDFLGRPVMDATGLNGHFNVELTMPTYRLLTIRYGAAAGVTSIPPDALQAAMNAPLEQAVAAALRAVGLTFERRSLPLDVIVVDAVDRTPTPN